GCDPARGARPLRRPIQRYIEDPLADFVLRSELVAGGTVMVEPGSEETDGELSIKIVKPAKAPTPGGAWGRKEGEENAPDEGVDDGGALDQPAVPPADPA